MHSTSIIEPVKLGRELYTKVECSNQNKPNQCIYRQHLNTGLRGISINKHSKKNYIKVLQ